jgi:hypothetical protein
LARKVKMETETEDDLEVDCRLSLLILNVVVFFLRNLFNLVF